MGQLTSGERELGAGILILLAILGIAMAAAGQTDPLGIHGGMIFLCSLGLLFFLISRSFSPEPDPARLALEDRSFRAILRAERLEAGRHAIALGASSMAAAEAAGYHSRSHFARRYREIYGTSPKERRVDQTTDGGRFPDRARGPSLDQQAARLMPLVTSVLGCPEC
jgi:AraC-like DNA-binding protein